MMRYLTLEEAVELHRRLIDRFGGAAGVRAAHEVIRALAEHKAGSYA